MHAKSTQHRHAKKKGRCKSFQEIDFLIPNVVMCNGCLADVTLITVPMFISVFIPIHSVLLCIGVDSMVVQPVNQFWYEAKIYRDN